MKIRFQADADLKHAIIAGALRRTATLDFRRAEAVPLEGIEDPIVLAKVAEDGRVLVSHDVNTMECHFREFTSKQTSPGLVLIPQKRVSIGQAIEGLVLLWEVLEAADLENRICLIPSLVYLLASPGVRSPRLLKHRRGDVPWYQPGSVAPLASVVRHWLPSQFIPHRHRPRAELQPAHEPQVDILR